MYKLLPNRVNELAVIECEKIQNEECEQAGLVKLAQGFIQGQYHLKGWGRSIGP